jgi:subfamily B ATP-binding cassette protein MsbA
MNLPQLYFRLLKRLIAHWKLLMLGFLAMLIMAISLALLPILIQQSLEHALILKDQSLVQALLLTMIALFIVRGISGYFIIATINKISSQLGSELRQDIFDKLLTVSTDYYPHLKKNHEIDSLILTINQITRFISYNLRILVQDSLTVLALIACIVCLTPGLSVLLLLVFFLVISIAQMIHDNLNKPDQNHLSASRNLIHYVLQSLQHYREIRANGGESQESQRLGRLAQPIYDAEMRQAMMTARIITIGQIITALLLTAIFYFVLQQAQNNVLNPAEIVALGVAILLLVSPTKRIANIPQQLQNNQKNVEILFSFLDQPGRQNTETHSIRKIEGKLTFEQVFFLGNSPEKPLLHHINFTIKPQETIVITSYSSGEKDAFLDLILRYQQPSRGKIMLDNYLLNDVSADCLHRNIALISKNSMILDERVAGNIAYGALKCANEAQITAAAQDSCAMEFIRTMPAGLQTVIGEEGVAIDQKQYQQIAIARALLKNPPILILDEIPTTDEADYDLLSILEKLTQNRTTLIFNRHIPPFKKINRIVVLENGGITEMLTAD